MTDSPSGSTAAGRRAGRPGEEYSTRAAAGRSGGGLGVGLGRGIAGFLLILNGLYGFFVGLAAVIKGGFFAFHSGYAYHWNIHAWGWLQLALGIVVFAAGVCILLGMLWARVIGAVLAGFSALASFLFIPYYPIWSIVVIAFDVFIIWALLYPWRPESAAY